MGPTESILVLAVCVIAAGLYFWGGRLLKNKVTELNKAGEYNRNKSVASAMIYPIVGLVLIGIMVWQLDRIPPENVGFAIGFIVFAVGMILYGAYRLYKTRRSD